MDHPAAGAGAEIEQNKGPASAGLVLTRHGVPGGTGRTSNMPSPKPVSPLTKLMVAVLHMIHGTAGGRGKGRH